MHSSNWDNLRYVLTVAEHGSLSAAARALGVNHATVLRRVSAFEDDHGGAVFEKTATGYRVIPDRERVIEAAREVERAVYSVGRLMHGARAPLRGVVRVSSTDSLSQLVLPGALARLHGQAPELRVDVLSSNIHLDFARNEADLTVRPTHRLSDDLEGEQGATMSFGAYVAEGYSGKQWLGLAGPLARSAPAAWITANIAPEQITAGADSFMVLREMARAGLGIAVLPDFVGADTPGLLRRPDLMPPDFVPIWVATYAELRDVPRIRLVRQEILGYLSERADWLRGPV
ncbi:LysR family transcriptional regulator [Arenibacterium halophilum]|uniref:LysR family transcriptional regulator n=1 Tax=Arenibacterium halophilum TaxID=2583821 RepID=A0ABY2XBG9_9RHOB|nr:LysR family transcriptional regulator [Arenibacterium halophilum]TMV13656.1 LysR family transcriptional regulator [Arenibacterium halophilum]